MASREPIIVVYFIFVDNSHIKFNHSHAWKKKKKAQCAVQQQESKKFHLFSITFKLIIFLLFL